MPFSLEETFPRSQDSKKYQLRKTSGGMTELSRLSITDVRIFRAEFLNRFFSFLRGKTDTIRLDFDPFLLTALVHSLQRYIKVPKKGVKFLNTLVLLELYA